VCFLSALGGESPLMTRGMIRSRASGLRRSRRSRRAHEPGIGTRLLPAEPEEVPSQAVSHPSSESRRVSLVGRTGSSFFCRPHQREIRRVGWTLSK
jgi:hypothetical protein